LQKIEAEQQSVQKADFLYPAEPGSIEEAGFEFATAQTEEYRRRWWNYLLERATQCNAVIDLPKACANNNHYENDEHGRAFDFCPDCGKPLN